MRSYEIYTAAGHATKVNTTRSVADTPHNNQQRQQAKQSLRYPAVRFDGKQANLIANAFAQQTGKGRFRIHACAIMPDHVHLVIGRHHYAVEQVANLLKGAATRGLKEGGKPGPAGRR